MRVERGDCGISIARQRGIFSCLGIAALTRRHGVQAFPLTIQSREGVPCINDAAKEGAGALPV